MERVVVSGLGAVCPMGLTMGESWMNLLAGNSGITRVTRYDQPELPCQVVGEVKGFNPKEHFRPREASRLDPFMMYGIVSAREAIEDAELDSESVEGTRAGVITGVGLIGYNTISEFFEGYRTQGTKGVSRHAMVVGVSSMLSGAVCREVQFKGVSFNVQTACASSTTAIGLAYQLLRSGAYDVIVAIGSEATIMESGMAAWCAMSAAATRYNDRPEEACRPFDKERDGLVMSEGATALVLERESHAKARGRRPYAYVAGYGTSNDAQSPIAPMTPGQIQATNQALIDAGISASDIDYVNSHGTGTILGDMVEAETLLELFGEGSKRPKIGATKSMTGHGMGATGAFEAAATALTLFHKMLPPNLNMPDPIANLGWVGPTMEQAPEARYAMSSSFGFGGHNGVLVFEAPEEGAHGE